MQTLSPKTVIDGEIAGIGNIRTHARTRMAVSIRM